MCSFSSLQFQLVADLFHEKEETGPSKSRVNVRPAKSVPKIPNKDHKKTVGHQVMAQLLSLKRGTSALLMSWMCFCFSSVILFTFSWTL